VRPPSLLVAIAPVLVGVSLGYRQTGSISISLATLALLAAILMQVITNLQNDVGYTARGAEARGKRTGLPRATALGWLTLRQVRTAIVVLSLVATALGLSMVAMRGWPVLAIGCASLAAALAYMGGPRPIAYTPWGELTVFVFFGPVAVLGTGWLLTGGLSILGALASIAVGSIAAAALAINNHRDIEHDRLVGRKTFAVTFGAQASQLGLAVLLAAPFLAVTAMAFQAAQFWPLSSWVFAPVAWYIHRDFVNCPGGIAYNALLFRTFRLGLWFAALLSTSTLVPR
jgi:1,4-dihydroxy-2-naphthoate octaprenyltransferase